MTLQVVLQIYKLSVLVNKVDPDISLQTYNRLSSYNIDNKYKVKFIFILIIVLLKNLMHNNSKLTRNSWQRKPPVNVTECTWELRNKDGLRNVLRRSFFFILFQIIVLFISHDGIRPVCFRRKYISIWKFVSNKYYDNANAFHLYFVMLACFYLFILSYSGLS